MHQGRQKKPGGNKLHFRGCGELKSMMYKCDGEDLKGATDSNVRVADMPRYL